MTCELIVLVTPPPPFVQRNFKSNHNTIIIDVHKQGASLVLGLRRWRVTNAVSFTVTSTQAGNTGSKQVAQTEDVHGGERKGGSEARLTVISVTQFGCPVLDSHQCEGLCPSHHDTCTPHSHFLL